LVTRRGAREQRVTTERGALLLLVGFGLALGLLFALVEQALFAPSSVLAPVIGIVLVVLMVPGWLLWRAMGPVGASDARGSGAATIKQ
jgi:uncharacterized membrane protein